MSKLKQRVSMPRQNPHQDPRAQESLEWRQRRKVRNRRISAGALSVGIVILSLAALTRAREGTASTVAGSRAPIRIPAISYRLAYQHHGEVYVTDATGGNPVRITDVKGGDGCGSDGGPVWSPDGRYLAFRCGFNTVTIADPRGRIVTSFRVGMGWHVAWSPDSTRVAVWARPADSSRQAVAIYAIDGSLLKILPVPRGFSGDYDPSWSPDGQSIFVHDVELPLNGGPPHIAAGGDSQPWCCPIAYSPDGTRAAYTRGTSSALMVSPIDGSAGALHVANDVQGVVWSPSGDRIAYGVRRGEGYDIANAGPVTEIRTVDIASGNVTSVLAPSSGYVVNVLGFSSDGARILFCRMDAFSKRDGDRHPQLWSVGVDSSDPQLLAKGADLGEWQP